MPRTLVVLRPGLLTTVQDSGRTGYQDRGMPPSGAMDRYSLHAANRLVGNGRDAPGLEVTLLGPEVRFECDVTVAVTGAQFALSVDGRPFPFHEAGRIPAGGTLKFGHRERGARSYLAVAGGFDVPRVLGSGSTHLGSRTGGHEGRALKAGDVLSIGDAPVGTERVRPAALPLPQGVAAIRVLPGMHGARFGADALQQLASMQFQVSPQSNRIGYRLEGGRLAPVGLFPELISLAMPVGAIQVPSSGTPILLMADRGTTGGYPVIAVVISADLPLAGQLAPGDAVRFLPCEFDEAIAALRLREAALSGS